jgi:hypothetical protein
MKSLPRDSDLLTVTPRIIWFKPAERALADPVRFLAYLMTYGTLEDIAIVQRYLPVRTPERHWNWPFQALLTSDPGHIGIQQQGVTQYRDAPTPHS